MAQAARQQRGLLEALSHDVRDHPLQNGLAVVTLVLGVLAAGTAFTPGLHLISSWAGLVGALFGLWGQYISETTAERFVLIIFLGAAAFGFFMGMWHGGLFGGVIG
jgi:hypothetical protein